MLIFQTIPYSDIITLRLVYCTDLICLSLSVFVLQGSRDNMSVVLVCLPGAPKISEEAMKKEEELDKYLETRVEGQQHIHMHISVMGRICLIYIWSHRGIENHFRQLVWCTSAVPFYIFFQSFFLSGHCQLK